MASKGGAGKVGLWVIAHRTPLDRDEQGFTLEGGFMLAVNAGSGWLFSFGVKGIGTVGFGWVSSWQRQHDAEHEAAHQAEQEAGRAQREVAREVWESLSDDERIDYLAPHQS